MRDKHREVYLGNESKMNSGLIVVEFKAGHLKVFPSDDLGKCYAKILKHENSINRIGCYKTLTPYLLKKDIYEFDANIDFNKAIKFIESNYFFMVNRENEPKDKIVKQSNKTPFNNSTPNPFSYVYDVTSGLKSGVLVIEYETGYCRLAKSLLLTKSIVDLSKQRLQIKRIKVYKTKNVNRFLASIRIYKGMDFKSIIKRIESSYLYRGEKTNLQQL